MGRLEEIEHKLLTDYRIYKKWVLVCDFKFLLSEIRRLREAIEEIKKSTNDSVAYGIAGKALEEK